MEIILISGLASACVLTAIEGLVTPLGKWRGLLALALSSGFIALLGTNLKTLLPTLLAATFVGLTLSIVVEQLFTGITTPRQARGLPNKVDRL